MATKERCYFTTKNQQTFNSNFQHENLNLNGNQQFNPVQSKQSKSNLFDNRKANVLQDTPNESRFDKLKQNSIWKNEFETCSTKFDYLDLQHNFQDAILNPWNKKKKKQHSSFSNSTLSLHIASYENTTYNSKNETSSEISKSVNKKCKNFKELKMFKTSQLQNLFEFPRQQNEDIIMEPEIMQFKASQKLLNPSFVGGNPEKESASSTNSANISKELPMATKSSADLDIPPIISDDEEENIALPKKVRKKLLIDSSDDEMLSIEEEGDKDIEEDLESKSEDESLAEDEESTDGDSEGAEDVDEDDDEEEESDKSDASSLLSFDSEFSWDEFQYIDDNAENSFIQDEEESLRERYNTVMKMLLSEQAEEGFDSLSILYEEPLIQKQLTSDFTCFDWEKAKSQFIKSCEPKMRMLTFGITRALARFAKDPTLFYLQALSLRPTDKALWYEFGCSAARLQNFKTSEMAFKQCLSPYSDAGIKLAIVYFYSKDYHKCLPLLREMLTSRPSCLALWVLKSEITKINKFWKFFVELYFPSNSLFFQEPTISTDVYEKILHEIHNFTTTESPPEKFRSDYSIQPLHSEPIRLNVDQSMEAFTEFICKYFDQSAMQQLPFQQTVHFAKEKRHHSSRLNHSSLNGSIKSPTPLPDTDSLSLLLNDESEAVCSSVITDMINIIEDVEFVVEKLVNNVVQGKIPKPVKPKRRPPRKNPNLSLDVRRSGRTSKEIPFEAMDSPVIGTFQQPTNAEPVTIRTLLGLPSNDSTFPPLDFPGAQGFPFDDLNDNIIPSFSLETFNVYLTTLLNKQHMPMEELLHSFLCFFSWNLPSGCQLTVEQQKLFLEIYIRWAETFCQPFEQHCINASIKDISIHLLAAELDADEKLKSAEACEIIFGRYSGILQKQLETNVKLNVVQKGEEGNMISDKAMRSKAIQLLSDVDPEMAAKIKICMEESRISLKSLSKDSNVEDALGSFAFTKDDYYAGGLKPVRPKVKKQNVSTVEPQEKSAIEVLVENEFDTTTLTALNLCEPTTSAFADLTMPKTSEFNAKFFPLWSDLSKIMQRVVKDSPKELNDTVAEGEMSPMNEADMMSLLNGISFDDEKDNDDVFESLREIHGTAQNQKQVEGLLKEYLNLLEKFVQEFKYKKEVEADAIKTFMNETKKAIEAMKSVLDQNLMDEDIQMDEVESDKLKEFAVRFYWLKTSKLNNSEIELKKAYLSTILHLMDLDKPIYTQIHGENGKYTVVTAKEVVKMLMHEFRREKIKNISKLIAENKHQEVILQFTTDFNWYSCDEKEIITNIQILLSSFEAVKDRKGPVEWICRLLDRVISGKFEAFRDNIYLSSLQQLEQLNLEEVEHEVLRLLVKRLVVFSEYDRFKKNVRLWKILYRVASILEGQYDDENSRLEMYQTIEAYKSLMPTKALCLLVEGHRILGEEHHCCTINNGELLYFFIDELYKKYYNFRFEDNYYSKLVQRNIELQLIQCLKCLFDSSIGKTVVYDHECSLNLIPTIAVAKKVQPFLIPNLPMFDDEKFTTNDVIDALTRVFPFIENERISGFDQAWSNFEEFIQNPPFFKFQEIKKSEIRAIGDFENANLWPSVEITDENREKLELFVYLRYVLLVIKYKKQAYTWEENEKLAQLAKECLVLSGPPERKLLPLKIIHSLWAICAYTHTMYFCSLEDDELAVKANSYFYMFKMAFLQYPEAFQLHIDIAIAYYQINSRIGRHKASLPNKRLPEEIDAKIEQEDMMKQCQLHFNQFRYRISQTNEYPKDISWIEAYFSGKIAEHNNRPPSEIFEHYYRCAMLMRAEAYTYPLRVNKTTQENVEPLELHYRVHVYAMKQIFSLENIKSFEKRIENLKIIRYYLRLFLGHFIFAKKNHPPLPSIESNLPFIDSTPPWDFEEQPEIEDEGEEYNDDPIQDMVELMVNYTDLKIECLEYCRRAYETIVKRFPHYKSYYQLAALHFVNNEFKQGLEIIFGKLFRGKFVSFEKVIDIERTDIERSNSLSYHITKLIRLTIVLLKKCRDIPKTNSVLEDLVKESSTERLKLNANERTNFISLCLEIYSDAAGKVIRSRNIEIINSLIKLLEKASSILRNNKRPEFDEKIKHLINRCRNVVRNIFEAREKQRNNELAASHLQTMMKVQEILAGKQQQDLAQKVKQVAEEQAKKQREEEERKKRVAAAALTEAAEKKRKETAQSQSGNNLLAYQKILDSKKAEEAKKAKATEIMKLVTEKLNRIVNNPYLLPDVKKQVDERRPALMDALKDSVGKGESLVTLINQLDKFDNSLQKSYPTSTPTSTTNIPSRTVQQVHRNGSSNSMQKKQHQISSQPINLSSKQSTSSSLTATVSSTSTVSKSQMPTAVKDKGPPFLNRNIQIPQQPTTPQKASIPQPSRNATLQPPLLPTSQSQKSPQPSPSKSSTTPSKAAPVDDKKSREQVINEIGKLLSQYGAPNEMNEFEKLKSAMLQKTTQELQNVYSTMFVRYICGKVPATNVQSASDTTSSNISSVNASGKRAAQQISPSSQSNTVPSKVRRSDATTTVTPSSSSQTNSSRPRISHPNSQQKNVTNLQTPSISQNSPQQKSSSATVSKSSQPRLPQTSQHQQQQQYRFDHLTEQVKKILPKTISSTTTTKGNNEATSDDDIMIIGETKNTSSSSKNIPATVSSSSSTPSTPKSTAATKSASKEANDRRIAELMNNLAALNSKSPQTSASSSSRLPQTLPQHSRSPQTLSSQNLSASKSRTQQPLQPARSQPQNITPRSNLPSTSTSAATLSNLNSVALANYNALVQHQMQHLLQNVQPQDREQMMRAFLALNNPSSTNQKR